MIIDIHAHTSNHPMVGLHTTDATLPTLKKVALENGVERVCLMATYFPYKKSGIHNRVLLERIAGDPFFRVFGSLDMTSDFLKGMTELDCLLKDKLIVGIKLYPGYQLFSLDSERSMLIYLLALRYDVPVMIHGGSLHHCCRRDGKTPYRCGLQVCPLDSNLHLSTPKQLVSSLRTFPGVKFIMSHLAHPYLEDLRNIMKEYPNLSTDFGGTISTGCVDDDTPEEKQHIADEIKKFITEVPNGIHKVMFATDFPIQGFHTSVELLQRMGLKEAEEEFVKHVNAEELGL